MFSFLKLQIAMHRAHSKMHGWDKNVPSERKKMYIYVYVFQLHVQIYRPIRVHVPEFMYKHTVLALVVIAYMHSRIHTHVCTRNHTLLRAGLGSHTIRLQ